MDTASSIACCQTSKSRYDSTLPDMRLLPLLPYSLRPLHVQKQELTLPRADNLHERLELCALDSGIGRRELGTEHVAQRLVRLEQVDRLKQPARQVDLVLVGGGQHRLLGLCF